jgi:hypothetical protein
VCVCVCVYVYVCVCVCVYVIVPDIKQEAILINIVVSFYFLFNTQDIL